MAKVIDLGWAKPDSEIYKSSKLNVGARLTPPQQKNTEKNIAEIKNPQSEIETEEDGFRLEALRRLKVRRQLEASLARTKK